MNLLTLSLIGISLSVDSLAASITSGACAYKIKVNHILKVAFFMAFFQGTMPLIGWLIGHSFKNIISNYDHWVAFLLLIGIGGKILYDGMKELPSLPPIFFLLLPLLKSLIWPSGENSGSPESGNSL